MLLRRLIERVNTGKTLKSKWNSKAVSHSSLTSCTRKGTSIYDRASREHEKNAGDLKTRSPACGGDEEDRTLDLTDANRTLSQLSYAPKPPKGFPNGEYHYSIK